MSSPAAFAMALVVVLHSSSFAQLPGSVQGVWRPVSRTIPATANPGDRSDPFAHVPVGTQANVQPGLMIFTARHYSRTTDTATTARPTIPEPAPGNATLAELQARWGPFQANAGTYELSGQTLTLHVMVAKNPAEQRQGQFARLRFRTDGDRLWLTPIENSGGRIVAGVTTEYARVE
jgi:hypothetical protein